ncbi:hypothetical protein JTB14_005778 [Gonioctena quinquepunctata]|nr:hypothetical protein JTB14_005778 [Gonioctena quinquepunctata]
MEEVSTKSLPMRRNQRITEGTAPIRYSNKKLQEKKRLDNVSRAEINLDEVSTRSENKMDEYPRKIHYQSIKSSKVSGSKSRRYRQLKIELDRERKLSEIEEKQVHEKLN